MVYWWDQQMDVKMEKYLVFEKVVVMEK